MDLARLIVKAIVLVLVTATVQKVTVAQSPVTPRTVAAPQIFHAPATKLHSLMTVIN